MNVFKIFGILLAAIMGGLVLAGGCLYGGYNRAIALDEEVKNAWAQVDSQLQRRFELIPNLVETVKGFAAQEKDIFLGVAKARESYFQAKTTGEKAQAAGTFESALSRLLVFTENYPALKSNESFLKLQDSLEGTENRLAVERMRYNEKVKQYNYAAMSFEGRLWVHWFGFEKSKSYFEATQGAEKAPSAKEMFK